MSHEQKKEKVPGWELSFFNVILMLVVSASLALMTALYLYENNADRVSSILLPFIVFFLVLGGLEFFRTQTVEKDWKKWRDSADSWRSRVWKKNNKKVLRNKLIISVAVGVVAVFLWARAIEPIPLYHSVQDYGIHIIVSRILYSSEAVLLLLFSSVTVFFVILDR